LFAPDLASVGVVDGATLGGGAWVCAWAAPMAPSNAALKASGRRRGTHARLAGAWIMAVLSL
jgi:hypothetical protein